MSFKEFAESMSSLGCSSEEPLHHGSVELELADGSILELSPTASGFEWSLSSYSFGGIGEGEVKFSGTFSDYSAIAASTACYPDPAQVSPLTYCMLGLAGEAGEVLDKYKKVFRDHGGDIEASKQGLLEELGDALWYTDRAASNLGSSLEEVARMNNEKLQRRLARGTIQGEGDER